MVTRDVISFTFASTDDLEIDRIPLYEIEFVSEMKEKMERRSSIIMNGVQSFADSHSQREASNSSFPLQISTIRGGYNSGRSYYIQADSKESREELILMFTKLAKSARKRHEAHNVFRRVQLLARSVYESFPFQTMVAALILAVRTAANHQPAGPVQTSSLIVVVVVVIIIILLLLIIIIEITKFIIITTTTTVFST